MIKKINNWLKKQIHDYLFTYDCVVGLGDSGKIPTKAYKNDAGYDLYTSESITIKPHSRINVHTSIYLKNKRPMWILLMGRSSTLIKYGLIVDSAVIDADYTGELFIKVYNTTGNLIHLPPSIRIAQLIVLPHTTINFRPMNEHKFKRKISYLDDTVRNGNGFGSSGL